MAPGFSTQDDSSIYSDYSSGRYEGSTELSTVLGDDDDDGTLGIRNVVKDYTQSVVNQVYTAFSPKLKSYSTIWYDADLSILVAVLAFSIMVIVALLWTCKVPDRRVDPNQEFVVFLYDVKKYRPPEPPHNYTFPEPKN